MKRILNKLIYSSEVAAVAAAQWIGRNDSIAADQAAVQTMRNAFNNIDFSAKIVIGEGERDKAPMLHIGEIVGKNEKIKYDIAVDPLECTTRCAENNGESMTAIVIADSGMLLPAPDIYMQKIVCKYDVVHLNDTIQNNLEKLSRVKGVRVSDLVVSILKRNRHTDIIQEVINSGAKLKLIDDGDISAAIMACTGEIDLYLGIGGAPEGVIAAAAVHMLNGHMQGKLIFDNESQKQRANDMINDTYFHDSCMQANYSCFIDYDVNKIYSANEMVNMREVQGNIAFIITGITNGQLLKGVRESENFIETETLCLYKNNSGKIVQKRIITKSEKEYFGL